MKQVTYDNMQKLSPNKPVYRLDYFSEYCKNKSVLDLGSYDETAIKLKMNTDYWLFSRLEKTAKKIVGVDIAVPEDSIMYNSSVIYKRDVYTLKGSEFNDIDIITAGEILEHLDNPSKFFQNMKNEFPGKELLLSTPNGLNFSNTLMGMIKREVQHPDHIHLFTYKTLNTLCRNAKFQDWEIIPYHFFATEMKLQSKGAVKKGMITMIEKTINGVEYLFPLLSMGNIVKIKI